MLLAPAQGRGSPRSYSCDLAKFACPRRLPRLRRTRPSHHPRDGLRWHPDRNGSRTYDWSSWAPRGGPIGRCPGYLGHLRRGGVIFGHPRGWHTPPPSARRGRTGASARSVHGKPDALIALRHTASASIRYERPPRDVGLAFCGFTSFAQLRLPQGDVAQVSFSQLAMASSSLKFCLRTRSGS